MFRVVENFMVMIQRDSGLRFASRLFVAILALSSTLVADESSGSSVNSEPAVGRSTSWLDSLRPSNRRQSSGGPESNAPRKRTLTSLISQSSEEASPEELEQLAIPTNEPAEPVDTIGPIEVPGDESMSVVPELDGSQPTIDETIQSRPPMAPERVFSQDYSRDFCWQVLPNGLLYKTYLAGDKEPRMQFLRLYDRVSKRTYDDAILGARLGIVRYGTKGAYDPNGFQLDLEGAVFARVLPEEESTPLMGSDYRAGLYGTWRDDKLSYRFGYYHISSHVGDEFLINNPGFVRINYVRDSALAGISYETSLSTRVYGEMGYALGNEGGAEPLEFQWGAEYTPLAKSAAIGAPFAAVNRHIREDFNFGGGWNVAAGWGWQGPQTGRRIRLGLNYYRGPSLQWEFFDQREELLGGGIWVDF